MSCRRCGTCCAKGGPALHGADAALILDGAVGLDRLVTLRAGEPVLDQLQNQILPLAAEIIKVRGPHGLTGCVFHLGANAGCSIYQSRPLECRLLDCEDPAPLAEAYAIDRLTRTDLLGPGHPLLELLRHHDKLCPAAEAFRLARDPALSTRRALAELLSADRALRSAFLDKTGASPQLADFLFGRPLPEVLAPLGLRLPL
jgi:hypothetical protein